MHVCSHYAEYSGYWKQTSFLNDMQDNIKGDKTVTFYDSGYKGRRLFTAPRDRSWQDFMQESTHHGWPSFRDREVDWENVRVLPDGETVSIDGTHLGHNLPDRKGNRYCISEYCILGAVVDFKYCGLPRVPSHTVLTIGFFLLYSRFSIHCWQSS